MEKKVVAVLNEMAEYLSVAQMKKLQEVMLKAFMTEEAEKKDICNRESEQCKIISPKISILIQIESCR